MNIIFWSVVWVISVAFYLYCAKRNALPWRDSFDWYPVGDKPVTVLSIVACILLMIPIYNVIIVSTILMCVLLDEKMYRIFPTKKLTEFLNKGLF